MRKFSVDRFEGAYAILVDEECNIYNVSRSQLPAGAKEGMIISYDGKRYKIDTVETEIKKENVRSLINELFR